MLQCFTAFMLSSLIPLLVANSFLLLFFFVFLGYNTSKLLVYGPFDKLFPWLLRRLDENKVRT